jgi:hypothetical protein
MLFFQRAAGTVILSEIKQNSPFSKACLLVKTLYAVILSDFITDLFNAQTFLLFKM